MRSSPSCGSEGLPGPARQRSRPCKGYCRTRAGIVAAGEPESVAVPSRAGQGLVDDPLRLVDDSLQVSRVLETLGVDFVNVFRAGRPGGEPAADGHHLEAA